MNEFSKARLKLTALYIGISALMLVLFTFFALQAEKSAFNKIQEALSDRVNRPRLTTLLEKRLNEFEANFLRRLLIFDAVLLLIASGASYYLSAKTLKPIEQMVKAQQEFAADASHELRTPLTTISMEIEALKRSDKNIPNKYKQVLESIKEETVRMKGLVEGLLTLVRPGEDKKSWEKFDLGELANECFEQLKPLAKEKQLNYVILNEAKRNEESKFRSFAKSDLAQDDKIVGNRDQIKQVILILLDNAIKYTPKLGKVELSLLHTTNYILLTISDTGPGIPPKDLPHIFDRFYRGATALADRGNQTKKGAGLGLSIAKKIVEEHGGKIEVESKLSEGSKFSLSLQTY